VRAIKADTTAQRRLLDLQAVDSALAQLDHRRRTLPEHAELTRNEKRIADGTVPDPKALSSMVEEVAHLRRRIGDLEDAELEVMQQLENAVTRRSELQQRVDELAARAGTLTEQRDARLRELAEQAAGHRAERERLLPDVPADLLALYSKIGASHNGVGAAELRQRRCTRCQLEVNAAELRAYAAAPPEEVLRCEECGRILVRTAESGL
jgi:predicted  nucleic acid-binding Zn-ribbon protein